MECLIVNSAETTINEAIAIIDAFVDGTSDGTVALSPPLFRELSHYIERAKSVRILHPHQSKRDLSFAALCVRYQRTLGRLQIRLHEIETGLKSERNRLLEEESQLARVREWNTSLNRTQ
jgi:hypothetical protein